MDSLVKPIGTKFILGGGLKREASEARKNGSPGAHPGKIFHDHALEIVGKRPIFGKCAIDGSKDHDQ